jgi:TolB-like protein/Tfp pilus assembly protein PilF
VIGTTLAHYRITAALGAGGMGEVWRATDEKLGREVALKVLPEKFAESADRLERFEREARAVASLNHPHIVTIHSVEEAEGVRFLTMELVDGETLDGMIPDGGFELEPFFDLATPLAEAISAAHDKSVIHRDLKPTNVMVDRDGRVKVMDFGLAKVQDPGVSSDSSELPTEALTGIGMVVGTVPYMSPEQIEGEIVDHRTDIFSLGVLLYEMAIGERPFQGKSSPALMSSILKDVPRPVVELRSDLPRHLGRIIGRCLEKNRRGRYQTARDVFNELKALQRESLPLTGAVVTSAPRTGDSPTLDFQPSSDPLGTDGVSSSSETYRQDEGFWVAVLPFKHPGDDADLTALAEGLSEGIVTGLSRFSYLRVIAQGSKVVDGRYLMEGSLRRAGTKLRIAVQLVDKVSGAHLWAETYDRPFKSEEIFALQDELVPQIVSTVGDAHGVLPHTMSELLRGKAPEDLTPYEAVLRSFGYGYRRTPEEHAAVKVALERAVEEEPRYADAWAMLALVYVNELAHGYNLQPDPLGRALRAARRAADAAPSNATAFNALAWTMFFRREIQAFRTAADQSIALNPLSSPTLAGLGALTAYSGDWERGCALVKRALELNPRHPGWYWLPLFYDAYRKGDYRDAVNIAFKINLPEFFVMHEALAAAYGQLGEPDAAGKAFQEMVKLKPDYATTGRERLEKWFDQELVEHMMDGLQKAGLVIGEPAAVDTVAPGRAFATALQVSAETKSIVVLPFANLSPDPDAEYFSDGLTDEIITDLSRVRALRVISRSSAMRLKGDGRGLAAIGRDLDCRYVLEGSVRRAANTLRITARLVDAPNDDQLWADKYRGTLDDVFDIQERVSRSIVDALEIRLSPQEAEQLAERPIPDVRAQECYLRARREIWSFLPGGLDMAISHLEAGLALIGDNALLYQGLGEAYFQSINIGIAGGREEEYIKKAESCAEKIFALEPESPRGSSVRAHLQLARGDIHGCARSWRRVLQAFPKDVQALQLTAHILGWLGGKPDAAAPLAAQLVDIDPLDPMSRLASVTVPLFAGRFEEALEPGRHMFALDPVTPVWRSNYVMALSYNQRLDEAEALTEGLVAQPDSDIGTWWMGLCRAAWRGDRAEVLRLADGPYQQAAAWDAEIPWVLASAHAAVGATEEALLWLDRAIDRGMINYPFLSEHDRYLDSIRGDARFGQAMERVRREWERFDV